MNSILMILCMLPLAHSFVTTPSFVRPQTSLFANKKKKSDSFDMKELKHRINELTNPYHELFAEDWNVEERPEQVHVVLFNPDTEEQGLHSIEYPAGSGSNFVLAFSSKEAVDKFASTLKAQNFAADPSPTVYELDALESFCDMLGIFVQVVPDGMEILPPTKNVQTLGKHNRHLKEEKNRLDYIFGMFEMEVDELGLMVPEEEEVGAWE
ncbi:Protein of unknown function (DUF3110) [Seminavis robusta]|uniref:Uncharacterized protein n=1 Tax=Seminavis robusta TaxID=568900 RepID=A0A9N8D9R4_9STRA|nr:Protein of unknown function (DUF3110) [Seminavis robusta]|eukprot:Sro26_g017630.1 Protein of unknown function (DUF3110) (210) ;mRNA; f:77527-78156